MFSDTVGIIVLLLISVPVYLALSGAFGDSRRRSIHATDDLVLTDLIRESKERELEIANESFRKRLDSVRNCEKLIYGPMPDSKHPEQLKPIVSSQQAGQYLGSFLEYTAGVEKRAEEQQAELERHLEEKRVRILEQNRRFRVVDRILAVSAALVRVWLVAAVLVVIVNLVFGPFW